MKNFTPHPPYNTLLMRLPFMCVFVVIMGLTRPVLIVVAVLQFLCLAFTQSPNAHLLQFSAGLSTYVYEIAQYLTYQTEKKPFPFNTWPRA